MHTQTAAELNDALRQTLLGGHILVIQSRSFLLVVLSSITLTACAQTSWQDFTGDNRDVAELRMDGATCKLDSQQAPQASLSNCAKGCLAAVVAINVLSQAHNFNLCMEAKGWQQVQIVSSSVQKKQSDVQIQAQAQVDDTIDIPYSHEQQ